MVTEDPRGASGHGEQARPQTDRAPDAGRRVDGRQSEGCDDDTPRQGRATGAGSGGRDFAAVGPDKLWLADITFVPTATVNDLATQLQSPGGSLCPLSPTPEALGGCQCVVSSCAGCFFLSRRGTCPRVYGDETRTV